MNDLTTVDIIILVVAAIAIIVIIGWRSGGMRATKMDREAKRIRDLDE